jgi:hypothetical protein
MLHGQTLSHEFLKIGSSSKFTTDPSGMLETHFAQLDGLAGQHGIHFGGTQCPTLANLP